MAEGVQVSPESAAARRDAGLAAVSWEQWSCEYDRMTFGECVRRIREDYVAHGRDWSLPGFRTMAVYRFGNWRMNIRSKILRAPFSILYRFLFRRCRNRYGIELPYAARVGRRVVFEHQHGVTIHGNSVIGDDCIIRQGVTLGVVSVDRPHEAPKLGRGVDVGPGARLLGAITIGDNARIGPNAVVLSNVPAGATAFGIPARIMFNK